MGYLVLQLGLRSSEDDSVFYFDRVCDSIELNLYMVLPIDGESLQWPILSVRLPATMRNQDLMTGGKPTIPNCQKRKARAIFWWVFYRRPPPKQVLNTMTRAINVALYGGIKPGLLFLATTCLTSTRYARLGRGLSNERTKHACACRTVKPNKILPEKSKTKRIAKPLISSLCRSLFKFLLTIRAGGKQDDGSA